MKHHPRHLFKRFMPKREHLRQSGWLRFLGERLHDPELWHLTRRSAAGSMSVGMFSAFIPVPSQMVLAAIGALIFRVNLPIAVACVWITNPVTTPPMLYVAYRIGAFLLRREPEQFNFEFTWSWFAHALNTMWAPILLGSLVLAIASAVLANLLVRALWRLHLVRRWRERQRRRAAAAAAQRNASETGTD